MQCSFVRWFLNIFLLLFFFTPHLLHPNAVTVVSSRQPPISPVTSHTTSQSNVLCLDVWNFFVEDRQRRIKAFFKMFVLEPVEPVCTLLRTDISSVHGQPLLQRYFGSVWKGTHAQLLSKVLRATSACVKPCSPHAQRWSCARVIVKCML